MKLRFVAYVVMAALLPPVAALLVTRSAAGAGEKAFEQRVVAASTAVVSRFEGEAARRRELLLRLVMLPGIAGPVHEAAEAGQPPPLTAVTHLREAVADLFPNEAPELLAVATSQGSAVIITSGEPKSVPAAELPLAAAALNSNTAELFQHFPATGPVYRFTAAPIGIGEGAIVVGDRVGDSSAIRWREAVSADITLVLGGKLVASTFKPDASVVIAAAGGKATGPSSFGRIEGTLPIPFAARLLPLMAETTEAYRSFSHDVGGASAIVTVPSDLGWVVDVQAAGLLSGLIVLVVGLIWIRVIYGPVNRQARVIEGHLARLRVERTAKLTSKGFSPPFTDVAEMLDKLTEQWTAKDASTSNPPPREPVPPITTTSSAGDLPRVPQMRSSSALPLAKPQPVPPELSSGPNFPFRDDEGVTSGRTTRVTGVEVVAREAAPAPPPPAAPPPRAVPSAAVAVATRAVPPVPTGPAQVRAAPAKVREPPPAAAPPVVAAAKPAQKQAATAVTISSLQLDNSPVPLPAPTRTATREMEIPSELLDRSQELEQELLAPNEDAEDQHFHAVFDEFITVRRRCGEPNDGLTFEKFSTRLRKNRDQLLEKYACKTVRFQVYVKDGKAAVKALPVR